jgi:hypothetical protein
MLNDNNLFLTLAIITICFAMISVIIIITYSIVNWGQIGSTGVTGITGVDGLQGIIGPNVSTIIRTCFKEATLSPVFSPTLNAGEFTNNDTVFFDITIFGFGIGGPAEFFVTIVNDNVDLDFDNQNTVKVIFPENKIGMATFRVFKGVSKNTLNLAVVNTNNVTSIIIITQHAPSVTGVDINKSLLLRFTCSSSFNIFGRILNRPSSQGFLDVAVTD